jgi:hypothetical protein
MASFLAFQIAQHIKMMTSMKKGACIWFLKLYKFWKGSRFESGCRFIQVQHW